MPVFKVLRRVEALVDYVAEVEADDPSMAAELACEDEAGFKWKKEGTLHLDDRMFVTLDEQGVVIDSTQRTWI